MIPPHAPQSLPRVLGPVMAAAVVVGTVIGSGVFKKGNVVADNVPEFGLAISVWVLVGGLTLLGALSLTEVAVRYPKAGGNYVFLREGYGRPAGFLWGWVEFGIIRTASIAVLAYMFVDSFHEILKQVNGSGGAEVLGFWTRQLLTCLLIITLSAVNARGTRIGGGLQVFLTVLKIGSIVGLILLPFVVLAFGSPTGRSPESENYRPVWPTDWGAVNWSNYGSAMVAVLWAYHGWMNIGPIAEEVRNPQRNIPRALIGGVVLIIGLYVGAQAAYYSAVPQHEMKALGDTPVATEFCKRLIGPAGVMIASLILMTSTFGALNGNVLVAPRLLYAMGDDGLAPKSLRDVHPRYRTPARAIAVYAMWSCLLVLAVGALMVYKLPVLSLGFMTLDVNIPAGKVPFDVLTDYAMFGAVCFETLAVAAIFRFRFKDPAGSAALPYRCPGYPVVPAVYVVALFAVLANMFINPKQRSEALIGLGFIAAGAVVYAAVSWRRKA